MTNQVNPIKFDALLGRAHVRSSEGDFLGCNDGGKVIRFL